MILQCPNCNARFKIADHAMPPEGRTVKCGRCAHSWHATLPTAEIPQPVLETPPAPVIEGSSEPAESIDIVAQAARAMEVADAIVSAAEKAPEITHSESPAEKKAAPPKPAAPAPKPWNISKLPFMIATPVLALVWMTLLVMTHYPTWIGKPGVGSLYSALGIAPTDDLLFEEMNMQRLKNGGKTKYILTGSIANHASTERVVPTVRVMLNDAEGATLWEKQYEVNEPLKGGDVYPFRIDNVETAFGDKVASIVVDVGHSLQLRMR